MADSSGSTVAPASESDATAPPIVQTSKLLTIAPELRNSIYELVFTKHPGPTDLLTATPPSSDLLSVCKQTRSEAHGLWVTANRDYWPNTTFTITTKLTTIEDLYDTVRVCFTPQDLASIRTLLFTTTIHKLKDFEDFVARAAIPYRSSDRVIFEYVAGRQARWLMLNQEGKALGTDVHVAMNMGMEDWEWAPSFQLVKIAKPTKAKPASSKNVSPKELYLLLDRKLIFPLESEMISA
ncbi:hypothetical protein LTR17_006473 [Elasticomyces elasticus]|nr:hypothetical protein LTR17_006473 [Elasticomyces elasticus]